jgi:DNA polymerase III subunit gamma/tau
VWKSAREDHPAVFEIDAASHNSVDDARLLIERAPLVAVGGRRKVYIIDECHMLTKEAFNALLKTIEEPPPDVTFILATTEEHKVPPTILSRCQRLMFRLAGQDELAGYLRELADKEKIEIQDEALRVIARRSGGGLRDALGLLDQASLLSAPGNPVTVNDLLGLLGAVHEDVLVEISAQVLDKNGGAVLAAVNKLIAEGREPAVIATEVARHFLNLTKASYLADDKSSDADAIRSMIVGSPEYVDKLCEQAPKFDRVELAQMVEQLDRLEQACRRTTQPAMTIEMGMLALCHRHDVHLVRELAEKVRKLESSIQSGSFEVPAPRPIAPAIPAPAPKPKVEAPPVVRKEIEITEPVSRVEARVPKTVEVPKEAPRADDEDDTDVNEFKDRLVDELTKMNKMAVKSLIDQMCIIQSISKTDVVVGVPSEVLKSSVESKAADIGNACAKLLGRTVHVRARIFETVVQPQRAKPAEVRQPVPAVGDMPDDADSEPEPSRTTASREEPSPVTVRREELLPPIPEADDVDSAGLMKEAYKLFEGPGSRQIG